MYNFIASTAVSVLILCQSLSAQQSVTGTVTDMAGEPLSGAHVSVVNSLWYTFTGTSGEFLVPGIRSGEVIIQVTHIGFGLWTDTVKVGKHVSVHMELLPYLATEVVVQSTRLSPNSPGTFQNIDKEELEQLNMGQDFPFLIHWTPSLVATSDAGAGVGYTGIRIRGSDQSRINVTVNGIPINDPESQGVFWVNMPDLASSMNSVQIQRGLGTSTNGSGAFGASINIETSEVPAEAGAQLSSSYGSFNTWMRNLQFQTGRLGKGFWLDGRLSAINSDGYIDRATSDLESYYFSTGFAGKRTMFKAVLFSGSERTYQSWYGTPQSRVENDEQGMLNHAIRNGYSDVQTENLLNSGRTYNYYLYANEVDNYFQDHYQLHVSHAFEPWLDFTGSLHYTYGSGYFEQFREDDEFADYGLSDVVVGSDTLTESDFVRRRWLDNHFYGGTYALNLTRNAHKITLGGALHLYNGDHFGEIIWAEVALGLSPTQQYYFNTGRKDDFNSFLKWEYNTGPWNFMGDVQWRYVAYETEGIDNDLTPFEISEKFNFINPKLGTRYDIDEQNNVYFYAGLGSKEPARRDFVDAPDGYAPTFETMINTELGYTFRNDQFTVNVNGYFMKYRDQLVLTGQLNDVGASVRTNVPNSYRLGVESDVEWMASQKLSFYANLTLSRNKIETYTELIYDYTDGFEVVEEQLDDTDIGFSPSVIGAFKINWIPIVNGQVSLISKYVGGQFLDNTQNNNRSLDPYSTTDLKLAYILRNSLFKEIELSLLLNNVFNAMYSSNGYTFSYIAGETVTENFLYPQAGVNFLASIRVKI